MTAEEIAFRRMGRIDIDRQYLAMRDSPHHTPETRLALRRLYERDTRQAGGKPLPATSGEAAGPDKEGGA